MFMITQVEGVHLHAASMLRQGLWYENLVINPACFQISMVQGKLYTALN